ncbi:hypothetical protein AHAS_Ahas09G0225200 [Arachis hypogaea]
MFILYLLCKYCYGTLMRKDLSRVIWVHHNFQHIAEDAIDVCLHNNVLSVYLMLFKYFIFIVFSPGDGNRNMILGRCFFVTPSDSVAVIAANAREAIPYFKDGVKGLARSMPTSGALMSPLVGNFLGILWMLGSYQFAGKRVLEQALTTFVRRMASAWLSIIAHRNKDKKAGEKLISVADVVKEHWATYGRNFFSRYDYEECESEGANKMVAYLRETASKSKTGDKYGSYVLQFADDFTYTDPVDGSVVSKQGVRFVFSDGSRIIYRLSGTGSAGATVRVYIEQFEPDASKHDLDAQVALKPLISYIHFQNQFSTISVKAQRLHRKGEAYSDHIMYFMLIVILHMKVGCQIQFWLLKLFGAI